MLAICQREEHAASCPTAALSPLPNSLRGFSSKLPNCRLLCRIRQEIGSFRHESFAAIQHNPPTPRESLVHDGSHAGAAKDARAAATPSTPAIRPPRATGSTRCTHPAQTSAPLLKHPGFFRIFTDIAPAGMTLSDSRGPPRATRGEQCRREPPVAKKKGQRCTTPAMFAAAMRRPRRSARRRAAARQNTLSAMLCCSTTVRTVLGSVLSTKRHSPSTLSMPMVQALCSGQVENSSATQSTKARTLGER